MRLNLLYEAKSSSLEKVGVFIKLPKNLASQYPSKEEDSSPPHITTLYCGDIRPLTASDAVNIVKKVAKSHSQMECFVGGLAYFTNPEGKEIAHSMVEAKGLWKLRDDLLYAFKKAGVNDISEFADFTPHVTLEYGDKRDYNEEDCPNGSFIIRELEIWGRDSKVLGKVRLSA
jgi:2'-5' RNA ligase